MSRYQYVLCCRESQGNTYQVLNAYKNKRLACREARDYAASYWIGGTVVVVRVAAATEVESVADLPRRTFDDLAVALYSRNSAGVTGGLMR